MQIARVFGTPIRVDSSWLLIFALLVWTLSTRWSIAVALLSAIALFVCVVAHELAHVAAARSYGIRTYDIVLFAFGGVSRMEEVGSNPRAEAQIAFAGPALSLLIGIICASAAPLFAQDSAGYTVFTYLMVVNLVLAAFNLIPAYPVDGGRLVHAFAWRFTRDRFRATVFAVRVSLAAGMLMVAAGMALLVTGYVVDGVWVVLLSWFIMRAARAEYVTDTQLLPLAGVCCAELIDPPSGSFQPDMICAQALARMMELGRRAMPVAVSGRLLGIVTLDDFVKLGTRDPNYVYIAAIMTPAEQLRKLRADASGLDALKELVASGHPQLPVVDRHGTLLGFITQETLRLQGTRGQPHITQR